MMSALHDKDGLGVETVKRLVIPEECGNNTRREEAAKMQSESLFRASKQLL
jgi:hypothetical protein